MVFEVFVCLVLQFSVKVIVKSVFPCRLCEVFNVITYYSYDAQEENPLHSLKLMLAHESLDFEFLGSD